IGNTCLLYALARNWPPMRHAAFWAAALFAVQEGHQEAVVWFAGFTEPAQFLFGVGALVCWQRRNPAGILLFALALLSKESAIILLPLFLLVTPPKEWRSAILRFIPYAILGVLAVASIFAARANSFRFSDGSFSLHAPFWITWPRGVARVLWVWGWL